MRRPLSESVTYSESGWAHNHRRHGPLTEELAVFMDMDPVHTSAESRAAIREACRAANFAMWRLVSRPFAIR